MNNNTAGGLANFFNAASEHGCKYKSYRPECIKDVAGVEAATFKDFSSCRGVVHFDAVYIVAMAVGFLPEYAYWLAAFSQAVDFVQFEAVDACGNKQPPALWTPPLRGLLRTSASTGGSGRHLGMPFGYVKTDGLHPNLTDMTTEGDLASYRLWARGESDLLCTNGMTEEVNGFPYGGKKCAAGSWMIPHPNVIVSGPIPADFVPFELGEQVIHYDCGDKVCNVVANATYAHEFEDYLKASEFAKLKTGEPVPIEIAKMGTYLHLLADKASHYWCTDSIKTGTAPVPNQPGNFSAIVDTLACNAITHAMQHYWEQGVRNPLAPQSWAALRMYYDELISFKAMSGSEVFFNTSFTPIPKGTLIGTEDAPGRLPDVMMEPDGTQRVGGLNRLISDSKFAPLPGFATDCAGNPW